MADDYPSNSSTTGRLPVDGATSGTVSGMLEAANDSDWFAVGTLRAGYNYQFNLSATPGFTNPTDLGETLVDSNGSRLVGNNNTTKSITNTPAVSATDYIVVSSNGGDGLGTYTLTSSPKDDYPSNSTTSTTLNPGSSVSGTLEANNDIDWFIVPVRSGYNTQITLTANTGMINPTDLGETLVNVNGTRLAGTSSITKTFSYVPTGDGNDYVVVTSNGGDSIGNYTVSESRADDYLATSATSGKLAIGGSTTGQLEGANDSDWVAVNLIAGSNYQFNLAATAGFINPTDLGMTLVNVNGTRLAGSSSTAKTITYTPASSGTYFLAVSSNGGDGLGTYALTSGVPPPVVIGIPVYRFFDTIYGTHLFTQSQTEAQSIAVSRPDLTQETNGFGAVASTNPSAEAVYRFFEAGNGTHFFTASFAEYQGLTTPGSSSYRSDFTNEAASTFYEDSIQQAGDVPVYRLFDATRGTQFLTGNQTEYNGLTTPGSASYRPDLTSEGIAFYAPAGTFHT